MIYLAIIETAAVPVTTPQSLRDERGREGGSVAHGSHDDNDASLERSRRTGGRRCWEEDVMMMKTVGRIAAVAGNGWPLVAAPTYTMTIITN